MGGIEERAARHSGRALRRVPVPPRRLRPTESLEAALPALLGRDAAGVTAHVVERERAPRTAAWPEAIDPRVREALAARGIAAPWTHQAEAMRRTLAGQDVVVVSPTASGKSLCYAAPLLSACLRDPDARALLVFPTKALALDQAEALRCLVEELRRRDAGIDVPVSTFDGDTPADVRRAVRRRGRIVVTNPDMLHSGILPHHGRWGAFFEGLRHVVIDELHAYRGVFGSHVAHVIGRLQRLAGFHGSRPTFTACSATIANPAEHATRLLGRRPHVVDDDGAPRGRRHVLLLNPPIVQPELGRRASAVGTTRRLAARCLLAGLQTIVFATSRLEVELLTRYLEDAVARGGLSPSAVAGYRGGLLPSRRRAVQGRLRDGSLRGVVATSALELGIDVGSLDVAILCGHPGTIASARQQMGRAGRRGRGSACILVAKSRPLDQHVVTHPDYFFGASPEHARIDPGNLLILAEHAKCAAFELPFRRGDSYGALDATETDELLTLFGDEALVQRDGDAWHWTHESHPAEAISLRAVTSDNFVVIERSAGEARVIAEVDFPSAPTVLHEKAIHFVGARQYQVERLDYENRKAYVRAVECDYFTDAMTYRHVAVLETFESKSVPSPQGVVEPAATMHHGDVRVSRKVTGFKKLKLYTMENLGYGDVVLPEHDLHVTAWWLRPAPAVLRQLEDEGCSRREIVDALVGIAHALRVVGSVLLACDPRDLGAAIGQDRPDRGGRGSWFVAEGRRGAVVAAPHEPEEALDPDALEGFEPTLFLHETVPGGAGFAPLLHEQGEELLTRARAAVVTCGCEEGCPGCVGPPLEVGRRTRSLAARIFSLVVRAAEPGELAVAP